MKLALWIFPTCALALALTSCGNSGPKDPGAVTGPFDSNGNYREDWADNPSKWRKTGGKPSPHELKSDQLPELAGNTDQPPANAVPLVTSGTTPVISKTRIVESTPKPVATSSKPTATTPKSTARKPEPEPEKVVAKAKPKPKPKPTPVKVKPKSVRYTVKKGDSLSSIASRNGTSVSSLRSANGLSGSMIRPGQTLTIPKK